MTSIAVPRFASELERAARYPLVWKGRRLSLDADSGQVGTLVRAATGGAFDSAGVQLSIVRNRPRWERTVHGVGLRLGAAAGALTEYVYWDLPLATEIGATPSEVALSGLFDFVENGTAANAGGGSLAMLGATGGASPKLYWTSSSSGIYAVTHDPVGSGAVGSFAGTEPGDGAHVRLRWSLFTDGSVRAWISIDGAAEVAGAQSAPNAMASAWASPTRLWLNTLGTTFTYGSNNFLGVVVMQGNQSLSRLTEALR